MFSILIVIMIVIINIYPKIYINYSYKIWDKTKTVPAIISIFFMEKVCVTIVFDNEIFF